MLLPRCKVFRSFFASSAVVLLMACLPTITLPAQSFVNSDATRSAPPPASDTDTTLNHAGPSAQLTPEQIGDQCMLQRRYQAAIEAYRHGPLDSGALWNKMGIANQQMFILQEAKKDYLFSLKLSPNRPEVMNNLGTVYYSLKQYGKADQLYRKALKLTPNSALIYKNLGTSLLAEDKFKKGWESYQAALAIDPQAFEKNSRYRIGQPTPPQQRGALNYFLAKNYARSGMTDLAIQYLRLAMDQGYAGRKKILADRELASLYDIPAFHQLLGDTKTQSVLP